MNTYNAYYKGKVLRVVAETSYKAQLLAAKMLKAKKSYDVAVFPTTIDGKTVLTATASL